MIQAVIFDMDGVLVDSEPVYYAGNQRLFAQLGIQVDAASYERFVGLDAFLMWKTLKQENGLPQPVSELVEMEASGMLSGLHQADLSPIQGVVPLLQELQKRGLKLALASTSGRDIIEAMLAKLRLAEFFPVTVSGEDVEHGKPAPDIFCLAAERLGIEPQLCLVIEDSANGLLGAKKAGMMAAGFHNRGSGRQDLSGADMVVASLSYETIETLLQGESGRFRA